MEERRVAGMPVFICWKDRMDNATVCIFPSREVATIIVQELWGLINAFSKFPSIAICRRMAESFES